MVTSYSISQQQMLIKNNIQNKLPLFLSALSLPLKINTFTQRFNDNRQQNEVYQCNNRRIEKSKCTILPLKPLSLFVMVIHLYHFPQTKNRSENRFSSSPDPLSHDFYFQKGPSSCLLLLSLVCTLFVCSETILSPTKWKEILIFVQNLLF